MRLRPSRRYVPLLATFGVFAAIFCIGGLQYHAFFSLRVFLNLFTDNAFLGLCAVGMTFVIISGGIDLSVGAMVAFSSTLIAWLTQLQHVPAEVAIVLVLAMGILFGAAQGAVIHFFKAPAFIVTLAGMFLLRGLGFVVHLASIEVENPFLVSLSTIAIPLGPKASLSFSAMRADRGRDRRGGGAGVHEVRPERVRGGRQRAVRAAHGHPAGPHQADHLRAERVLLGAVRDRLHRLHALGQPQRGDGARAGRHRGRGHRRDDAHRRFRVRGRLVDRCADPGRDPDLHRVPGHAQRLLDQDLRRGPSCSPSSSCSASSRRGSARDARPPPGVRTSRPCGWRPCPPLPPSRVPAPAPASGSRSPEEAGFAPPCRLHRCGGSREDHQAHHLPRSRRAGCSSRSRPTRASSAGASRCWRDAPTRSPRPSRSSPTTWWARTRCASRTTGPSFTAAASTAAAAST